MPAASVIRCIVFDFDGTLVPSNAIKRDAFFDVVADLPGAAGHIGAILDGQPTADRWTVFRRLGERVALPCEPDTLADRYGTICEARIVDLLSTGATARLLDLLRADGLALHVSSGTPRNALAAILERGGLAGRLAGIHGHPARKPDILRVILSSDGLSPEAVAVVGDGDSDRAAAYETGCRFVAVAGDAHELHGNGPEAGYAFLDDALALSASAGQAGPATR